MVTGDFYRESGFVGMRRLLARKDPPTAVFAASDEMAVGALLAARAAGLRVPADLAVVGFDDIEVASLVDPALTTVAQDKPGFGTAAAGALLAMINNAGGPGTRAAADETRRPRLVRRYAVIFVSQSMWCA